jgi:hypothetical protein
MEENAYQLPQHELEVHEVMKVHREERVFPSPYSLMQDWSILLRVNLPNMLN